MWAINCDAGALKGLAGHRHRARWAIRGVEAQGPLLADAPASAEPAVSIPPPSVGENLRADYLLTGTTLGPHPLTLLRAALRARRCRSSRDIADVEHGRPVRVAGLVRLRQRPQTASGVTFITLEDEHGMVNVVVWRDLAERQRRELLESQLLAVDGRIEREDGVQHLIAQRLRNLNGLLDGLDTPSRDFR